MLIVIGLDSLDYKRAADYSMPTLESFAERGQLETPSGLGSDELITGLLWPSILMGDHPRTLFPDHLSSAAGSDESLSQWNNPLLDSGLVSAFEEFLVTNLSREQKDRLKSLLSKGGVEQEKKAVSVMEQHGSLLDSARNPKLISVPGINADDSNTELKTMVADRVNEPGKQPKESAEAFENAAMRGDADRLSRTLNAISARNHDLIFSHFYSLDLIQHIWVGSERKISRWYYLYDQIVSQVLHEADEDDTVVVISDHGMQSNGLHSKRAYYAATDPIWGESEFRMTELRSVLESVLSSQELDSNPEAVDRLEIDDQTKDHLEELGYFDS